MPPFGYVFPAIRGVQAGREYFVSMCPLRLIPRILLFDEDELKPDLRAQRVLNKARIPEIARYILDNPKDYTFSAITASVDGNIRFEPLGDGDTDRNIGRLCVPMDARFVINDGQHRRASIEAALRENPDLGNETISVVFFLDVGLKRCQQMFADLNRYAIRPQSSLGFLYDHRDSDALIAKDLLAKVPVFNDLTETERSTISNRSIKLFTLSGIYHATRTLLAGLGDEQYATKAAVAAEYWNEVAKNMPDWQMAKQRKVNAADLRRDYVHAHSLTLAALARAGATLLAKKSNSWKTQLTRLQSIDWSRSNSALWEGRAMSAGRLSKKTVNVILTGNVLKQHLTIPLNAEEQQLEEQFLRSRRGNSK
jgi:DNA sulfur modification protein DndB